MQRKLHVWQKSEGFFYNLEAASTSFLHVD